MIQARLQINGEIRGREQITGNINGSVKNIYPELENLEINPTTQKQYLKSEKYGYNEITVNEVTSAIDKNIKSEYIKNGITILGVDGKFEGIDTSDATASANDIRNNKSAYINGEKIIGNLDETAKISLNASKIEQISGGNFGPTGIVEYSEKDIIIKKGTQISMSMPSSVLADVINVTSENLLVGNEVLGVQGTATSDATVTSDMIIEGEIAYAKGQKITGNIKNNGELNYVPTTESQEIPSGYTSGGQVQGDANLLPENIKKGVTIFNVEGKLGSDNPYNALVSGGRDFVKFEVKYCLNEINEIDVSYITNMNRAFYGCVYLTKVGRFLNASNITNISYMFYDCRSLSGVLDLSNFGIVTDISDAFNCCLGVTKIILPQLNVTTYYETFLQCNALTEIIGLNTKNVTNYYGAFSNCHSLQNLEQLDGNKTTNVRNMFANAKTLENFGGILNLGKAYTSTTVNYTNYTLNLSSAPLTHESLMNVINGLYTIKTAQSLVLGANNLAKLTSDEIAIATSKGWNVS